MGAAATNPALVAALVALVVAQALKPLTARVAGGAWRPSLAVGSGGFPSSHSAFVTALASGTGVSAGLDAPSFAVACGLAAVVMYDAMGVRLHAGRQAEVINTLVAGVYGSREGGGGVGRDVERGGANLHTDGSEGEGTLADALFDEGFDAFLNKIQERPLREHIGHTPVQVLAGAVTGIVIGVSVSFSMISA